MTQAQTAIVDVTSTETNMSAVREFLQNYYTDEQHDAVLAVSNYMFSEEDVELDDTTLKNYASTEEALDGPEEVRELVEKQKQNFEQFETETEQTLREYLYFTIRYCHEDEIPNSHDMDNVKMVARENGWDLTLTLPLDKVL